MKAIIHIGQQKTGSTFLQNTLLQSKEKLQSEGFYYYTTLHFPKIRKATEDFSVIDQSIKSSIESLDIHTLLFSDENLFFNVEYKKARIFIEKLRTLVDEITVIVYLRKQEDIFISLYQQHCRGKNHLPIKEYIEENLVEPYFNYSSSLKFWSGVADNFIVRTYGTIQNGNIVDDFVSTLKLPIEGILKEVTLQESKKNISFDAVSLELLRVFNQLINEKGHDLLTLKRRFRKSIKLEVKKPKKFALSKEDRLRIHQKFTEDNQRLCSQYNLSDEDFNYLTKFTERENPGLYNDDISKVELVEALINFMNKE